MQIPHGETEERAEQEQVLSALGPFAGTLAHELNNQLTVVSGYCHLLLAQLPVNDAKRDAVQAISEANQRMAQWTRRMQAMSGCQNGQQEWIDLTHTIAQWAAQHPVILEEANVVRIESSESPVLVQADALRLRQWLDDLIYFVHRASDSSPPLTLVLCRKELPAKVRLSDHTEAIAFEVTIPVAVWRHMEHWDLLQSDASDTQRKLEMGLLMLSGAARPLGARFVCQSNAIGETTFSLFWPIVRS